MGLSARAFQGAFASDQRTVERALAEKRIRYRLDHYVRVAPDGSRTPMFDVFVHKAQASKASSILDEALNSS